MGGVTLTSALNCSGIEVLIDGAHALGALPLSMRYVIYFAIVCMWTVASFPSTSRARIMPHHPRGKAWEEGYMNSYCEYIQTLQRYWCRLLCVQRPQMAVLSQGTKDTNLGVRWNTYYYYDECYHSLGLCFSVCGQTPSSQHQTLSCVSWFWVWLHRRVRLDWLVLICIHFHELSY